MSARRKWTSSEKRAVGARQFWQCAHCRALLPATFEIDHVIPLHQGGLDCAETNADALCNHCHAQKTLRERMAMEEMRTSAIMKAKADAASLANATAPFPLRGNQPVLDRELGLDFLENRFLRFAFVKK